MSSEWYDGGSMIDPYEEGKHVLAKVADLGATRAGTLAIEIRKSLCRLNREGEDNEYLKYHLDALFTEFITGEDYDLLYYNKPKEPTLNIDPSSRQVKITYDNVEEIVNAQYFGYALASLDKGETVWLDKSNMSREYRAKNDTDHMVRITNNNVDSIEDEETLVDAYDELSKGGTVWINKEDMDNEWKKNMSDEAHRLCEGCPTCGDQARQDLVAPPPIKKKWYQEAIMDITYGWKVSLVGALIATGILGLCSLFAALIVYSEIVA